MTPEQAVTARATARNVWAVACGAADKAYLANYAQRQKGEEMSEGQWRTYDELLVAQDAASDALKDAEAAHYRVTAGTL